MKRHLLRIAHARSGASLAEFALILPILLAFTFGMIEAGSLMWQLQQGEIAAKRAVRIASTRELLTPGAIDDCGPNTRPDDPAEVIAGKLCSDEYGDNLSLWASCTGSGSGGDACGEEIPRLAEEVARFYPRVQPENIVIDFHGAGLGFEGLGHPIPLITVRFTSVQFDWLVLDNLVPGLATFNLPEMSASAPAEDIRNGE